MGVAPPAENGPQFGVWGVLVSYSQVLLTAMYCFDIPVR